MLVKELLSNKPDPVTIGADGTMEAAMKLLIENQISSLIIVNDNDEPIGIITERDIFHLAFRYRGDMMDILVKSHMTSDLIFGAAEDDLQTIARLMIDKKIRHVPIRSDRNKLLGIVSIRDIVRNSVSS